jgi:hypothetical protein
MITPEDRENATAKDWACKVVNDYIGWIAQESAGVFRQSIAIRHAQGLAELRARCEADKAAAVEARLEALEMIFANAVAHWQNAWLYAAKNGLLHDSLAATSKEEAYGKAGLIVRTLKSSGAKEGGL